MDFKNIELLDEDNQYKLIESFFLNYSKMKIEDIFVHLLTLRRFIIKGLNKEMVNKFLEVVFFVYNKKSSLKGSLIDLLGVMYKFLDNNSKKIVFEKIILNHPSINDISGREIVSISTFVKNIYKDVTESQKEQCNLLIDYLLHNAEDIFKPTILYNLKCMKKEFIGRGQTLIIIPEFLTGFTFLQPPIELLSCLSRFNKSQIPSLLDNRIYSYNLESLVEISKNYKNIVLISTTTDQHITYHVDYRFEIFLKTVNAIKDRYPNAKLIVCGAHGTVRPDIVMNNCKCDIILKGEVDLSLEKLLNFITNNENLLSLPNLVVREGDLYQETYMDYELLHPLDWGEVYYNYELLDVNDYFGYEFFGNIHLKLSPWGIVQTTRGCPYKCEFCYNFFGPKIRFRSMIYVLDELRKLKDRGVKAFFFMDQTFTLKRDYTIELCKKMVELNLKMQWYCQTRVGYVDIELLKIMKEAGCIGIWLGIESFDDEILKKNKKGYTSKELLKTLRDIQYVGINYNAFIMLGMLGESKESLENTVKQIKDRKIKLTQSIMICTPRYGAPLFKKLAEENIHFDNFYVLDAYKGKIGVRVTQEELNSAFNELVEYVNMH